MIFYLLLDSRTRDLIPTQDRDTGIIAYNEQAIIVVDTQGDWWHQGIGVIVNKSAYNNGYGALAEMYATAFASALFDHLHKVYSGRVSIRCGAWTSGPYTPIAAA